MAEQRMKVRDKKVQKMTKDGLVEENLTDKSSVRVSNRVGDVQMGRKQGEKEENLVDKSPRQSERSGKNIRPSVQKSRDAPELIRTEKQSEDFGQSSKQQNRKRIRAEVGKESRLAEESEAGQSGRLKEKRADLSENRGDSRRNQTGGSKKPKQKQRLKFAYEETGASVKNDKDMEKLNQMDTDGVNFRHQKQKEKAKKFSYEEARKKKEAKQHSKKAQVYQANEGETPGKKKSRLKFGEGESVKTEKTSVVKKAGSATSVALHREISKNEDDNAAVEGAHKLEESGEGVYRLEQRSARRRKQWASRKRSRLEAVNETVTETATVRVGESLGQVVTSGYCNCPICCGIWSGGPTASGAYPTANHTLAVDASNPFVPMGTKVVMNGVEYTVEDTGAFARYGVQFDVYYDSHAAASAHGHQTWECYLADDNGSNEVEVTRTRDVDVLNVTLNSGNLMSICQDRLGFFQKELFSAYNDTKGNLQMFATPVDFNWYSSVTSYYGYRIHPISGANQLHNGMDIGAPEGTKVMAGLTGTVTTSAYNDSYGNYVVIKDSKGYELRYAHLSSRSVSAGASVTKGDEIGLVGNTGNSTGSHLHIELLKNGERLNPIFYLETGEGAGFGGNEYTSEAAQRLLNEAARYLGTPYVWGGYSPSGFDCSGFVSYCLTHSGVRNTGRLTAQGLYDICTPVSQSEAQPGDLIFFTGTYDAGVPVTHIGIYVGNGQMIHCGHPVQYTSINSPYWQSHFYGFGRW